MKTKVTAKNLLDNLIMFENGTLPFPQMLELFSYLIKSGDAWKLQGMYGRTARALINDGYINENGDIFGGGAE